MLLLEKPLDIEKYCHTNQQSIEGDIHEILIIFQGLNRNAFFVQPCSGEELEWAHKGILMVIPYTQPWSWMNVDTVLYMNWLLNEIIRVLKIKKDTPIVSSGFSMGGLEALIYPLYSDYRIAAVMANSPVCDLPYHFTERDDLPRTLLSAFIGYPGGLENGLISRSPLHQVEKMPDIPYMIVSGGKDDQVNEKIHSCSLVTAMKKRNLCVKHFSLLTMKHWAINQYDVHREVIDFVSGNYKREFIK